MIYYVDANTKEQGSGTKDAPFRRISQAAALAKPGDEVLVYPGIYRENVNPSFGGTEENRIVYRSVEKHAAVITGAEEIRHWKHKKDHVYYTMIPNRIFKERNPFTTFVYGDWLNPADGAHTGDVFLNDKSMYEVNDISKVFKPKKSGASWDPEFSLYTWYTRQDEEKDCTVIWANFQGLAPNQEKVEVSVRKSCFYPEEEGRGYITLSGFTVCKAATQWAPPTAYQEGMIGPHWSKGWIIEDCEIYEAKCSGISLGKYLQQDNDNKWSKIKYKDGTQTERECILKAQADGWSRETVGSHIIRGCHIHDCGQTGIVGHLGGAFSLIEDNHIHHINNKQNLQGAEIGGIKMHAAIDCLFRRNHIHHCTRGLWLDWQAQGTRVSQCLFHHNTLPEPFLWNPKAMGAYGEDIFIEVSHGPTLIDNCLLLSMRAIKFATQGVALVNNLIAGSFAAIDMGTDNGSRNHDSARYTPYHVPHGTNVAGFMTILHGDDRFYNNIFVQQSVPGFFRLANIAMKAGGAAGWDDGNVAVGLAGFDAFPTEEEWKQDFEEYCGIGTASDRYYKHLPVWAADNLYLGGAKPWKKESNSQVEKSFKAQVEITEEEGIWYLETNAMDLADKKTVKLIDTETLGQAFEPEMRFENPDGTPISIDRDFFGYSRAEVPVAGPFIKGSVKHKTAVTGDGGFLI